MDTNSVQEKKFALLPGLSDQSEEKIRVVCWIIVQLKT
jgi:hypothetical protein